jgi:hypothetical protein
LVQFQSREMGGGFTPFSPVYLISPPIGFQVIDLTAEYWAFNPTVRVQFPNNLCAESLIRSLHFQTLLLPPSWSLLSIHIMFRSFNGPFRLILTFLLRWYLYKVLSLDHPWNWISLRGLCFIFILNLFFLLFFIFFSLFFSFFLFIFFLLIFFFIFSFLNFYIYSLYSLFIFMKYFFLIFLYLLFYL